MITIYKYGPLAIGVRKFTDRPDGAQVLHVGEQSGGLYLWALVETENPPKATRSRSFFVAGTGWDLSDLPEGHPYLGTVHISPFVWHVFGKRK